jgi:aspartate carbamoyltransferase regulatory subunit
MLRTVKVTATCPNPQCGAVIAKSSDVTVKYLAGYGDTKILSVACNYCTQILGTVSEPR